MLSLQGQDCRIVSVLGSEKITRCISRPSLDQSAGSSVSATSYDVSVMPVDRLRNGDTVELLDINGQVELTLSITKPTQVLEPLRVYIGQIL